MDAREYIKNITGKPPLADSIFMQDWASWYKGDVVDFHNYRIYNGTNYIDARRKTLGMAKQVCESWANLLMNERCDINVPDAIKPKLDDILNANNFWLKANEGIERTFALGLGALVVNVNGIEVGDRSGIIKKDKAKISVDFVNRYKILPITVENKNIVECAFVTSNSDTEYVVVHKREADGKYTIHNAVLSDGKIINEYDFNTKSTIPFYQIVRPNLSSNILMAGYDNEIGMSVFANSIDTLKAIDNKYDAFDNEYVLGRKRVFVKSDLFNHMTDPNNTSQKVPVFDPYNALYQVLPDNYSDGKPLIEDKSGDLRAEAYITGLNTELNILSMKCGLGETYYKMNGSGVATATQVITENSTLFRSIKKHEILLENVLRNLVKVVIHASNEFTTTPLGVITDEEIKIVFDDSIIEDKGAEMDRDKADVSSGLMSKIEYRVKWYGEDEDTALANIRKYMVAEEYTKYMSAVIQGVMSPETMIKLIYGTTEGYEEEIAYIHGQLNANVEPDMEMLYKGAEDDVDESSED